MNTKQRGVAIVEFALILPMLLLLTFITIELGRAIYQYNTIAKSVRDAVRYSSVQIPGTKIDETKNLVVYGSTSSTGNPLISDLTIANVATPAWQTAVGSNPAITTVTVMVTGYQFKPLFKNAFGVKFGTFTFNNISATMRGPA